LKVRSEAVRAPALADRQGLEQAERNGSDESVRRRVALWRELVRHELRRTYVGTFAGRSWILLDPLLLLSVYVFLFTVLRVPTTRFGGELGLVGVVLSGIVPWLFFARSLPMSLNAFARHGTLVKQVTFPIEVVPFVIVGAYLVQYVVGLAALLVLIVAAGWLSVATLLLVPATALLAIFVLATAALIAPYAVMLPDLRRMVPAVMRLLLFLTPVLYLPSNVPEEARAVTYANPMSYFISPVRYATFGSDHVAVISVPTDLVIACGLAAVAVALAYVRRAYVRHVAIDYV
jgi:lipopolysaccharide transport system permease protein